MECTIQKGDAVRFKPNFMVIDPRGWGKHAKLDTTYEVVRIDNGDMRTPLAIQVEDLLVGWFHPDQVELINDTITEGWSL